MNILVIINQKDIINIKDMILSFSLYNKLDLFFINIDCSDYEIKDLEQLLVNNKIDSYHFINKNSYFSGIKDFIECLYLLPNNLERILYVNNYCICNSSIEELSTIDLKNKAIIGVQSEKNSDYVDCGVLLFNLDNIRKLYNTDSFSEKLNNVQNNNDLFEYQVNELFLNNIQLINNKYNFQIAYLNDYFFEPVIVNYDFDITPWNDSYDSPNKGRIFCNFISKIDSQRADSYRDKYKNNYTNTPIISIIVPAYNTSDYLLECIKSISKQTFENIEIICINDGSTDNSLDILNNCKEHDNRIIIISQENKGLSGARNTGLDIVRGSYIGFVDSDDYIDKDMFMILYSSIKKYNSDIAICNYYLKKDTCEEINSNHEDFYIDNRNSYITEMLRDDYINNYVWSRLYKKELFDNVRFQNGKLFEDICLSKDLINSINTAYYVSKPLYYYRFRDNSITNKININTINNAIYNYYDRYLFIYDNYPELRAFNVFTMLRWLYYQMDSYYNYFTENFFDVYKDVFNTVINDYNQNNIEIFANEIAYDDTIELVNKYKKHIDK